MRYVWIFIRLFLVIVGLIDYNETLYPYGFPYRTQLFIYCYFITFVLIKHIRLEVQDSTKFQLINIITLVSIA